jgi:lactoylglutathione lyase
VKGGKGNIAYVEDPTGYKFELIEREKVGEEKLARVSLRVTDLDMSIRCYEKCLGIYTQLLRKRENPGVQQKLPVLQCKADTHGEKKYAPKF